MHFILYLILTASTIAAKPVVETHDYLETTDGKKYTCHWTLRQRGKDCCIVSDAANEFYRAICAPNGTTRHWVLKRPNIDVVCTRRGKTLTVTGTRNGKAYHHEYQLGDIPWVQPLSLALRRQVAANHKELVFWMLRPDNLGILKLKATYDGTREIQIGTKAIKTDRVRITSTSVLGSLWHSFYWFRHSDHVFVRYEGVIGLPLVPKTTVALRPRAEK